MSIPKGFLSMMVLSILFVSNLSILGVPVSRVGAESMGTLSGVASDAGVDMDSDGTFDALEVGVEINVTAAGTAYVEITGLYDSTYQYIQVTGTTVTYVDLGAQVVYVSLDGPTIYAFGLSPSMVSSIHLFDEYHTPIDSTFNEPLSQVYAYTDFDVPPAFLTGTIYDVGVDRDDDGAFDHLEIDVQVNVTAAGWYRVDVSGLLDSIYNYTSVSSSNTSYLDVGIRTVSLFLYGPDIYASRLNPSMVSSIYLYAEYPTLLDVAHSVPLSRVYAYSEFDLPPASLTGVIHDRGVDRDGDGAFDHLEVGVQINVTDAGRYRAQIWDLQDSAYTHISVSNHTSANLAPGLHVLNVTLRGPTINAAHVNPTWVSELNLYSELAPPEDYITQWLDTVHHVPMSREYLYTEFDASFRDMDVTFVVYPDGRVSMSGVLNYTDMEPPNQGPSVQGDATVQTSDSVTDVAATFTLTVPADEASQFPFNASGLTVLAEYADDLLTTTVSGSTVLPSSIASSLPFNVTDFTVLGTFGGDLITGNVTADMWTGLPLDDIRVDFQGNHTYLHLNGSTSVIFGDYPSFGEVNASVLDHLLAELTNTLGGQGSDSVYNMTSGLLEFMMLQNVTTLYGSYATVEFEAQLEGDVIQTLLTMAGPLAYYSDLLPAIWASIDSGSLVLTYTHTLHQADLNLVFVANVTQLIDHLIPILPGMLPSDIAAFIETMLTAPQCTVDAAQISVTYDDGHATIAATASIHDLNAELNYLKHLFLNTTVPVPWPSQALVVNATQIDLTHLSLHLTLTDTSLLVTVDGFAVQAPVTWINATSFTLEQFFNLTAGEQEPPQAHERLDITVVGGSNATHTVTITGPGTVPEPDVSSPIAVTWYNQSISHLKGLIFQLGPRDTTPPSIGPRVQTPPTPDFDEPVTVSVNVTDADPGVRPDGVILCYRTNGGAWTNVTMSNTAGDTYEGTIPAFSGGTHVEYMIVARDYADNEAIDDAAGLYYVYTVIPEFSAWPILAVALLLAGLVLLIMKRRHSTG